MMHLFHTTITARTVNQKISYRLHPTQKIARFALFGLALTSMSVLAAPPVTQLEYDANGNTTKITDGLNHSNTQEYDAVNRLIRLSQPHPSTANSQLGQINTQYNAVDEVTAVTDPRNLGTTYTRNAFGEILTLTSPDTGTTSFTYDNAGNLKTRTDARGAVSTYTYDVLNRLTRVTHKLGTVTDETVNYTYDAGLDGVGRLTGMTDQSGSTTWEYDELGHVARKQQRAGNRVFDLQTIYDTSGHLGRIIYPSGRIVDYAYNSNGQAAQITVNGNVMVNNITYHPNGAIKSWVWGNGQSYQRGLDAEGRTASYQLGDQLQVVTYDDANRITQLHRALLTTPNTAITNTISTYNYDNLDRLTGNVTASTSQSYQYDLSGNRTALIISGNSYPYSIDANSNRLNNEAGPSPTAYTYDAAGNPVTKGLDTYTYYNSGRLKQVSRGSPATAIYALKYNGLGQFVHKTTNNTFYLYDEQRHLMGEYNSTGAAIQETVYLGNTPVLTFSTSNQERIADNTSTATAAKAVVTGVWTTATTLKGFYGSNYHQYPATAATTDNVTYTITPTATQSFKVYARWVAQSTNANHATYTIQSNIAGSTPITVAVDQTQDGGTWNYLTTLNLNKTNPLTVTLSGQGNGTVIADAIRIVPNVTTQTQNTTFFIYTDHLDTPREIRSYANQTRWTWYPEQAEAFGANPPNDDPQGLGTFTYNLRFPGQLYDAATQLSYNYYRDYNPRTGRYITSDPIGLEGGINTYGYVDGNPLWYVDPEGLDAYMPDGITPSQSGHVGFDDGGESFSGPLDHIGGGAAPMSLGIGIGGNISGSAFKVGQSCEIKKIPVITTPYSRPSGATTRIQRESVQNKPCVSCGRFTSKQVADHKVPLVKEYYGTGTIDKARMKSLDAVQPQCPACSARQGAEMSKYSRQQKRNLGL